MSGVALASFGFEGQTVRAFAEADAPWFIAQDVCGCLNIVNTHRALAGLDEDEKGVHTVNTLGGEQQVLIVSESGLYALIFKSRKAEAIRFRKWVTAVVLPTLRRTGTYAIDLVANDQVGVRPLENLETVAGRDQARILLVAVREHRCMFGNAAAGALWIKLGFPPPEYVALPKDWAPSKQYLFAPDVTVARWKERRLIDKETAEPVALATLYADYRQWAERRHLEATDRTSFARTLSALGVPTLYSHGAYRVGVKLDDSSPP